MDTKTCTKCGETKPLTEFYPDPRYRQGVTNYCRECKRAVVRAWHEDNRAYSTEYQRHYQAERRAQLRAERQAANV